MSGSNRSGNNKALDWVFLLVGVILAVALAWGFGWLQAREEYKRQHNPTAYAEAAKRDAEQACVGTDPSAVFKCVSEKTQTAYQTAHDEQDLSAQQRAATSALVTAIFSFLALVLSGVGVWIVKQTLDATLEAVVDTGKATKAMERQNDLAHQAQRAWLSISFHITKFSENMGVLTIAYDVEFKNIGETIAQSVWTFVKISVEPANFTDKLRSFRDEWSKPKGPSTHSLMPGESKFFTGLARYRVDEMPWYGPSNDVCNIVINAAAFYSLVGMPEFKDRKVTMRAGRIGKADAVDALKIFISRRDLLRRDFPVAVSATGESITT